MLYLYAIEKGYLFVCLFYAQHKASKIIHQTAKYIFKCVWVCHSHKLMVRFPSHLKKSIYLLIFYLSCTHRHIKCILYSMPIKSTGPNAACRRAAPHSFTYTQNANTTEQSIKSILRWWFVLHLVDDDGRGHLKNKNQKWKQQLNGVGAVGVYTKRNANNYYDDAGCILFVCCSMCEVSSVLRYVWKIPFTDMRNLCPFFACAAAGGGGILCQCVHAHSMNEFNWFLSTNNF